MEASNKSLNIETKSIKSKILNYGFYIMFIGVIIIYGVGSSNFLTLTNLNQIFLDSSSLLVLATGLTLVIVTGSLDLSVGSIAFISAALVALLSKTEINPILAIILAILAGSMIGIFNGVLVSVFRMNPLLVTLGTQLALRGIGLSITNNMQIRISTQIKEVGQGDFGPIPIPVIVVVAILILVICQFVFARTKFGRHLVAVGCSNESARKMGINVTKIKLIAFILAGTFAGIAGVLAVINVGSIQPMYGKGLEFIGIAAVVIGGTSLFGGKGSILPGALMGVLTLIIIENGLFLLGVSAYAFPFVRGLLIFLAMYADSLKQK